LFTRIKELLVDGRTWSTLCYMVLQLPLGILYFTIVISWLAVSLALILSPLSHIWGSLIYFNGPVVISWLFEPLLVVIGILMLIGLMHFARGIAALHGHIAKALLVRVTD
ncbi:MAG: sensor domain-containing protein, partial [Gammaproteobacteria bacterium]|nr:sensor domain-containing protein [Gammaproteobacteria bacterium]